MADDGTPINDDAGAPSSSAPAAAMSGDSETIVFKDPEPPVPAPAPGAAAAAAPEDAGLPEPSGGGGGGDLEDFERPPQFEVHYTCLRCGTDVSNTELERLPEIKCICGYKVFIKVRPPILKTVSAV